MIKNTAICFSILAVFFLPQVYGEGKYFPPDAVIDVSKTPYHAIPNDGIDDTAALQRAITDQVGTGCVLYFPSGIYDLSDSLLAKDKEGKWEAHLTLQGQDRDRSILRLRDGSKGFGDAAQPKAILVTASHWNEGDSPDGGGNKAFRNNILDLTFDTGSGNPGAVGVDYAVSNQGSIRNVTIHSGDGSGVAGISMLRRIPGPGLIKNVKVEGFEVGIDTGDLQYGLTLEDVFVKGQKRAGIRTANNLLHIRKLKSENAVPAVWTTGAGSVLTMVDSELKGVDVLQPAIICSGSILLRNIKTEGYAAAALRWRGREISDSLAAFAGPPVLGEKAPFGQGLLTIEETPEFWNQSPAEWVAVGARQEGEADDTAAIQRALDSGKSTVYFPNTRAYHLSDTVIVRGKVKQLLGFGSEITLGAAEKPFSDRENPRPLIRIDKTEHAEVFFENMFFNAQYPGEVLFENRSSSTVVIRMSMGWVGGQGFRRSYRNTEEGRGKLFLEDLFLPGWDFNRQQVWARQLNPENYDGDGSRPQVSNRGGRVWILGFKTEGAAPFIFTGRNGKTELLGAYNYISATQLDRVPEKSVPYPIEGGEAWLSFATDNFRKSDYAVYLGGSQSLSGKDLYFRGGPSGDGSFAVPLYQSPKPAENSSQ